MSSNTINNLSQQSFIRDASVNDIATIKALAEVIWPPTYRHILSASQLEYMMEMMYSGEALQKQMESGHQFVVMFDGEEPVGFAAFNQLEAGIFKLQKIYILPSQQGRGTGKKLLDHVLSAVVANGAKELRLNVNRHNKAKGFYERLGFIVLREEEIEIGNGYVMDDYVMTKTLIPDQQESSTSE